MNPSLKQTEKLLSLVFLTLILVLSTTLSIWFALHEDGIYWPDEIYQALEQAHRVIYGYGLLGWEFIVGARNWTLPGLVAGLLKISFWMGWQEPQNYLLFIKLFFCFVFIATVLGSYCLARILGASSLAAISGASFFALAAPVIYFSSRVMSDTAAALPLIWGVVLILSPKPNLWKRIFGLSLIGFSVLLRLQHGIFCLFFLGVWIVKRDWKNFFEALFIFSFWAFLYGLIDKLTWGNWFHSALVYLQANIIEGKANHYGTSPFWYYFQALWSSMPIPSLILLLLAPFSLMKSRILFCCALAFVLIHSFIAHKEFRFIFPSLPLFAACIALGLETLFDKNKKKIALWICSSVVLLNLFSLLQFPKLTFEKLGLDRKFGESAFDRYGPLNRLLLIAHQKEDLCGLLVERISLQWTGGYSYLHRPVPFYSTRYKYPKEESFYNYLVTTREPKKEEALIASDQDLKLIRVGPLCQPDPDYDWKIP